MGFCICFSFYFLLSKGSCISCWLNKSAINLVSSLGVIHRYLFAFIELTLALCIFIYPSFPDLVSGYSFLRVVYLYSWRGGVPGVHVSRPFPFVFYRLLEENTFVLEFLKVDSWACITSKLFHVSYFYKLIFF